MPRKNVVEYLLRLVLEGKVDLDKTNRELAIEYNLSEKSLSRLRKAYKEIKPRYKTWDELNGILEKRLECMEKYDNILREILGFYTDRDDKEGFRRVAIAAKGFYHLAVENGLDETIGRELREELYGKHTEAKRKARKEIERYMYAKQED